MCSTSFIKSSSLTRKFLHTWYSGGSEITGKYSNRDFLTSLEVTSFLKAVHDPTETASSEEPSNVSSKDQITSILKHCSSKGVSGSSWKSGNRGGGFL